MTGSGSSLSFHVRFALMTSGVSGRLNARVTFNFCFARVHRDRMASRAPPCAIKSLTSAIFVATLSSPILRGTREGAFLPVR